MRSAIYNYINESTAAIIEQAINDNTIKVRVLPILPSDPLYSVFNQYKLVMNQHSVYTAETHAACLFEASKIIEHNYHQDAKELFTPPSEDFVPAIFSVDVSQMQDYAQRGYRSLAEAISMSDMIYDEVQEHVTQQYKQAQSVLIVTDKENNRYFIKPHESTRTMTFGVDYEFGEEGQMPMFANSKNIDAYSRSALCFKIKQSIEDKIGEAIPPENLHIKIYDEPFGE